MLAVIQNANGNYAIVREGLDTRKKAMVNFHQVCMNLWNDEGTNYATVKLVDESLNAVDEEIIDKSLDAQPEPEEVTE